MALPEPVVVLGGGGFIGSHLVRRLASEGCEVAAVDVEFAPHRRQWWSHASRVECRDLEDEFSVAETVTKAGTVFHLAADMGGVGYFHSDADLGAALRNGRITNNVLAACVRADVERLFYASSACAYPMEAMAGPAVPWLVEPQIGTGTPDALYGSEKLHGLRLCSAIPQARVGVLDTVYGPGQDWQGRKAKFPPTVAAKALAAVDSGRLELWGDGTQVRCYLWVEDAVDRILAVTEAERYDGPVNIGGTIPATCHAIAEMCLWMTGARGARIVTNQAEPTGALRRGLSPARFHALHGMTRERAYRDGFADLLAWLRDQEGTR